MKENTSENEALTEIRVINNISFTVPKNRKILNRLPLIIVALLGVFGTVLSFFSMYDIGVNVTANLYITMLYYVIFTIIFTLPRKYSIILLPLTMLWGFLLYRKIDEFMNGFKMLYNRIYEIIYPDSSDYFDVKNGKDEYIEIFLAFTIFLLAFIVCYSVYSDPNFFLGFVFTFLIVETGFYYGKSPKLLFAFMLIIYWVSLMVIKFCGYYQNISKSKSGFIRNGNMLVAKPGIRFQTAGMSVSVMAIICCIIFSLTALISSLTDYQRSDKVNTMRSDMKFAAREFSFDNLGESLERLSASLGFEPMKAYTHKLGIIGNISFKNKCELTVETDGSIDSDVYLKGYTGAVYTGDEWEDFPNYVYENREEMFRSFYKSETFPQDMLTNYFFNRYDLYYVNMNITSEYDREKYNYIPYISIPDGEITYTGDVHTSLENKKSYNFQVNKLQITKSNFTDVLSGLDYSINDGFDEYTEFVYNNYCDVENTEALNEVYKKFVRGTILSSDADIYQKLIYIKELLDENADYTLKPGVTPSNEDFVKYFLINSHKGYCMHFATAGIVLARMSGIPARYCDGYVLRAEDFNAKNRQADGSYKISVEDSRAHAWAEIYIEHLGWVPFEFTASAAALGEEPTQETTEVTTTTEKKTTKKTTSKISDFSRMSDNTVSVSTTEKTAITKILQHEEFKLPLAVKLTFILILTLLLVISAIILRHFLSVRNKNRNLALDDKKQVIGYAYAYTLELLKFCGTEMKNMQYLEFAKYAVSELPDILDGRFEIITKSLLKSQLSGEISDNNEAELAVHYYRETFLKVYNKSNLLKKIEMKFIKNL